MVPRQAFIVLVILQGVKDGLGQQKKSKRGFFECNGGQFLRGDRLTQFPREVQ